jgi:hypothetical protein
MLDAVVYLPAVDVELDRAAIHHGTAVGSLEAGGEIVLVVPHVIGVACNT